MTETIKIKPFSKDKVKCKGLGDKALDIKLEQKDAEASIDKKQKGEKTNKIKFEWRKDGDQDWKKTEVVCEYDGGIFFDGLKIAKGEKVGDATLEEDVSLGVKGGYKIGFWITLGVLLVVIVGGIWWWIASSKKEDKEEEASL